MDTDKTRVSKEKSTALGCIPLMCLSKEAAVRKHHSSVGMCRNLKAILRTNQGNKRIILRLTTIKPKYDHSIPQYNLYIGQ